MSYIFDFEKFLQGAELIFIGIRRYIYLEFPEISKFNASTLHRRHFVNFLGFCIIRAAG